LPSQSYRFKEASELISRAPHSGSNKTMRQPQPRYVEVICSKSLANTDKLSAPSHRNHPPSSKDREVISSRHPETDIPPLDRSRGSGHDPGHVYAEKFSRDDHMNADPPYLPRGIYEEPVRSQDVANRVSSHNDAMNEPISPAPHPRRRGSVSTVSAALIVPAPMMAESARGRSHDRSPRNHHETQQTSTQPSSTLLPTLQSRPPKDMQPVEDRRHRERRTDRAREVNMSLFGLNLVV
jgi:hypothetical protein